MSNDIQETTEVESYAFGSMIANKGQFFISDAMAVESETSHLEDLEAAIQHRFEELDVPYSLTLDRTKDGVVVSWEEVK